VATKFSDVKCKIRKQHKRHIQQNSGRHRDSLQVHVLSASFRFDPTIQLVRLPEDKIMVTTGGRVRCGCGSVRAWLRPPNWSYRLLQARHFGVGISRWIVATGEGHINCPLWSVGRVTIPNQTSKVKEAKIRNRFSTVTPPCMVRFTSSLRTSKLLFCKVRLTDVVSRPCSDPCHVVALYRLSYYLLYYLTMFQ